MEKEVVVRNRPLSPADPSLSFSFSFPPSFLPSFSFSFILSSFSFSFSLSSPYFPHFLLISVPRGDVRVEFNDGVEGIGVPHIPFNRHESALSVRRMNLRTKVNLEEDICIRRKIMRMNE